MNRGVYRKPLEAPEHWEPVKRQTETFSQKHRFIVEIVETGHVHSRYSTKEGAEGAVKDLIRHQRTLARIRP